MSTVASVAVLLLLAVGCTTEEPDPPVPTPHEPVVKYHGIPYDPCALIDLGQAEGLLGPLEYDDYFNNGDDEPDSMSTSGETWCGAAFDDGTDQSAELVIRLHIEDELVGDVSEMDHGTDEEMSWIYGTDFENQADRIPDRVALSIDSQWDSSAVVHFPEVRSDGKGWDPDGKTLAVYGAFAESNVWLYAYIWRIGTGATTPPDPEPYAELLAGLADQVQGQLEVDDRYEGN